MKALWDKLMFLIELGPLAPFYLIAAAVLEHLFGKNEDE